MAIALSKRPADVLARAVGGSCLSALDVGVASPDSGRASHHGDATEALRARKCREAERYRQQLHDA
eukprot:1699487-Prorocentrum_lima.AAC.1